jgi:hypothetical protein
MEPETGWKDFTFTPWERCRGGEQYIVAKHTLLKMKVLLLHAGNSPFVS